MADGDGGAGMASLEKRSVNVTKPNGMSFNRLRQGGRGVTDRKRSANRGFKGKPPEAFAVRRFLGTGTFSQRL